VAIGVTITTAEAAEWMGVSKATIRKWVQRGHLKPARVDANLKRDPLTFHEADVIACEFERRKRKSTTRGASIAS
jgi:DNA-binding transcriptional MerR regulator